MIINCTNNNFSDLMRLARQMHHESRFVEFELNEAVFRNLINNPSVFARLVVKDDKAVGFFLGTAQPMWFGTQLAGYDLAVYIEPEYRNGFTAVNLIREFEQFCKQKGCVTINVGSSAEIATDVTRRLYNHLGYKECGFVAHKEI